MVSHLKIRVPQFLADLRTDERGAALVEYGLLVALIALVCIVAVTALGNRINDVFEAIVAAIPAP